MNRSKGRCKTSSTGGAPAAGGSSPSVQGKGNAQSSTNMSSSNADHLNCGMADISIDSTKESNWEVISKSKNRAAATSGKPWGSPNAPNTWGHSEGERQKGRPSNGGVGRSFGNNQGQVVDSHKPVSRGNPKTQQSDRGWESTYMAPPPAIPPPLQHGWQWASRGGTSGSQPQAQEGTTLSDSVAHLPIDSSDDDDDLVDDSDDDLSDDYDSDASEKSHEARKKNKWLKIFFEALDGLTSEQINEQSRQWHCPACHDGPGAIDWYRGLQPLMTHAKTKGTTRVKLHRELALLLEEELRRRGTLIGAAGEVFGKWRGLRETTTDHEIVWPPMVVIMNTLLEKDENDKWLGMGNQELVDYFNGYATVKARHSYGPNGHRGMSVLIFEANAMGYLEAERLHKQFADEGRDRDAWLRRPQLFYPGGKRQLYGYLPSREDIDSFNQHSRGKSQLKYEIKSYQEMVVIPMRKMQEDNQQLTWLKNKVVKHQRRSKVLEETVGVVSQKLRETMEENRIVRLRTKMQHEEDKEEMDYQEDFFKEQINKIQKATKEKEQEFEKLLQEEHTKAKQSATNSGTDEDQRQRKEDIAKFIDSQAKGVAEFEAERETFIRIHEEKKAELKQKHLEEIVQLEREFDITLTKLMEKYAPSAFQASD